MNKIFKGFLFIVAAVLFANGIVCAMQLSGKTTSDFENIFEFFLENKNAGQIFLRPFVAVRDEMAVQDAKEREARAEQSARALRAVEGRRDRSRTPPRRRPTYGPTCVASEHEDYR